MPQLQSIVAGKLMAAAIPTLREFFINKGGLRSEYRGLEKSCELIELDDPLRRHRVERLFRDSYTPAAQQCFIVLATI
jgi:hypothetical protein